MLRIGKVYESGSKFYYIADKFNRKNKTTYIGQRVYPNGKMGPRVKMKFKRGMYKIHKEIKVNIQVIVPKEKADLVNYLSMVDQAMISVELLEAVNWRSKGLKIEVASYAWASCYYYNHVEGRYYNIRDFAKHLGFQRASRIYPWLVKFLEKDFTEKKYSIGIPDSADSTLISQVRELNKRWNCYTGFSKKIDVLLTKDLSEYMKEIRNRGLTAYI